MKKTDILLQESKEICLGGLIDINIVEEKIKNYYDVDSLDFKIKKKNVVDARLLYFIICVNLPLYYTQEEIGANIGANNDAVSNGVRRFRFYFLSDSIFRYHAIKFLETHVTTGTRIRIIKSFKKVN